MYLRQVVIVIVTLLWSAMAAAQEGQPFPAQAIPVWRTVMSGGGTSDHGSPVAACEAQRASFNPNAVAQPPTEGDWKAWNCHWLGKQDGIDDANTHLPAIVTLECPGGYTLTAPGLCLRYDEARAPATACDCGPGQSSPPAPTVGNPIDLQTGQRMQSEVDYASADGLLRVDRHYRSFGLQLGAWSAIMPRSFGGLWSGLLPGIISISGGDFSQFEHLSGQGGIARFRSTTPSDPNNFTFVTTAPSRLRLEVVTPPGVSRSAFAQAAAVANGPGELQLRHPDGAVVRYRRAGSYTGTTGRTLVPVEEVSVSGYTRWFDYAGDSFEPYRIRDSFGRQLTLTWQDIEQHSSLPGNPVVPAPRWPRAIATIALPDGSVLHYDYAGDTEPGVEPCVAPVCNQLVRVRRLSSAGALIWSRSYHHEVAANRGLLTGISDQAGNRIATYGYDQAGFANLSEHAGGADRVTVEHRRIDDNNLIRIVTGPLGYQSTYRFYRSWINNALLPRLLTRIDHAANGAIPARSETFTYASDLLTGHTDVAGVTTTQANNTSLLRPNSVTEAVSRPEVRTTTLTWHATLDLPLSERLGNLRVDYVYDAQGRMTQRTEVDLTTQTVPYSTAGQQRAWGYSWNAAGRITAINGPLAAVAGQDDITSFGYDAAGNLTSITNALGHVTGFSNHDANGRPGRMTDPNGVHRDYVYDPLGRVTSIIVRDPAGSAGDAVTSIAYDLEGRVTSLTRPDTAPLSFTYDLAGRLTAMTTAQGDRIDYTHDAMGNVTRERVILADATVRRDISRTFNAVGQLVSETLGPGRVWSYAWDAAGNLAGTTSPAARATSQAFDGLARLTTAVAGDGGTEVRGWNARDEGVSYRDAVNVTTSYVRNGFGEVLREVSPDRGTSTYYYDAAGRVTAAIDGRGQRIDYVRDRLGRVLSATPQALAAQAVTYSYDSAGIAGSLGVGRLAQMSDASGVTRYRYDHRGNLVERQQEIAGSAAFVLRYGYDRADRVVQIIYPSGRIVDYARDVLGRVSGVTTRASAGAAVQTLLSGASYEAFGALAGAALGNGLTLEQGWSADGRLTARRLRQGAVLRHGLAYGYDLDDHLSAITDEVDASRSLAFTHDAADRLSRVTLAAGATGATRREDYLHDANGNRTAVERRALPTDAAPTSTDTYSRAAGTNRIASIATTAGSRTFAHDARGNLAGEARPGGVSVTAGYDGFGRLTSYVQSGQPALAMTYNGHDERVTLTRGTAAVRRFIHDPDGRVIGEYTGGPTTPIAGAEGVAQQQYIWLLPETDDAGETGGDDGLGGWHPLAVVTADGAGGSPTLLWLHGNHLGVPQLATNAAGASVAMTGFTLPGFPGQLQTLPDLYYNQHRDYDPTTGRYIQADPIGLAGDPNPYTYAGANPIGMVDPEGLECLILSNGLDEPGRGSAHEIQCSRVDHSDELHVFGHGAEDVVCEGRGLRANGDCMTAQEFFDRYHRQYQNVRRIYIWACRAGRGDNSFAEQLSDLWGVPVRASIDYTWWEYWRGFVGIAPRREGTHSMGRRIPSGWRWFGNQPNGRWSPIVPWP